MRPCWSARSARRSASSADGASGFSQNTSTSRRRQASTACACSERGSQHEDRVQVLGREHVLDRPVGGAEAPAAHQRSGVLAARHECRELHVVPLDQCRQLRDGGDVSRADDADAGPGLRAHRALSAAASSARKARSAAADRAKPTAGSGRSCWVPAVFVLEGEDVVVAEGGQGREDAAPGHDAVADDARAHRALGRRDPRGFGRLERRVRVGEHEVLHVHVPDQVALDAQRLFVGLVVGERQIGLVVQDPYRGVVDLTHQPCRLGRRLRHGPEVVLHAQPYPGVRRFRRQRAQGRDEPVPVGRVVLVARLPRPCVDAEPVGAHDLRDLDGAAELVDRGPPLALVESVDPRGVRGHPDDRDTECPRTPAGPALPSAGRAAAAPSGSRPGRSPQRRPGRRPRTARAPPGRSAPGCRGCGLQSASSLLLSGVVVPAAACQSAGPTRGGGSATLERSTISISSPHGVRK